VIGSVPCVTGSQKPSISPDLQTAAEVIDLASRAIGKGLLHLSSIGGADVHQVLAYDLAHAASAVETARSMLDYGAKGDHEGLITCAYTADMAHDLMSKLMMRKLSAPMSARWWKVKSKLNGSTVLMQNAPSFH